MSSVGCSTIQPYEAVFTSATMTDTRKYINLQAAFLLNTFSSHLVLLERTQWPGVIPQWPGEPGYSPDIVRPHSHSHPPPVDGGWFTRPARLPTCTKQQPRRSREATTSSTKTLSSALIFPQQHRYFLVDCQTFSDRCRARLLRQRWFLPTPSCPPNTHCLGICDLIINNNRLPDDQVQHQKSQTLRVSRLFCRVQEVVVVWNYGWLITFTLQLHSAIYSKHFYPERLHTTSH